MRLRWIAMIALVPLAGCASRAPAPAPARPVSYPPGSTYVVSPATYVAQAASIDLFAIRSSELALVRARSAGVRDFATRMIAAHQGTSAQLSLARRRLNLLPPASMLPQQQAMYDELETAGDFDAAYLRLQRAVHGAALALHGSYAANGTSPTLRLVAQNAAAVERSHLDMLRRL